MSHANCRCWPHCAHSTRRFWDDFPRRLLVIVNEDEWVKIIEFKDDGLRSMEWRYVNPMGPSPACTIALNGQTVVDHRGRPIIFDEVASIYAREEKWMAHVIGLDASALQSPELAKWFKDKVMAYLEENDHGDLPKLP